MLRCLIASLVVLAGCESCEWTYGGIAIAGTATVIGTPPPDLVVRACDGPDGTNCGYPATVGNGPYRTGLENEGFITCGYPKRWLVFTGTGCETVAFGVLSHDDTNEASAEAAMKDLMNVDVTIVCCADHGASSCSGE